MFRLCAPVSLTLLLTLLCLSDFTTDFATVFVLLYTRYICYRRDELWCFERRTHTSLVYINIYTGISGSVAQGSVHVQVLYSYILVYASLLLVNTGISGAVAQGSVQVFPCWQRARRAKVAYP